MMLSEKEVRDVVRKVLLRTLGPDGIDRDSTTERPASDGRFARPTVTEQDVLAVETEGQVSVPANAVITPLARDTALERRVELVRGPGTASFAQARQVSRADAPARSTANRTVALGADHGGYDLKEKLKAYVGDLGYHVIDCGTHDTSSVAWG